MSGGGLPQGSPPQVLFTLGWLLADRWQGPGYSPIRYTISDETALKGLLERALALLTATWICTLAVILLITSSASGQR